MRLLLFVFLLLGLSISQVSARGLGATPADAFRVPEGFKVELIYEVPANEQGSWVSLTVDPQGRLVACDQYGSLYRVELSTDGSPKIEKLETGIGAAQGLLFAFDSLYVNVNDQSGKFAGGIYRLRDTTGDDQYDLVEHILPMNNGGEHGPHALILSPDGRRIYFCAGNNTNIPEQVERFRVPQNWSEDHLLGRMPDARGHNANRMAPGGFVATMDPDGKNVEVVATGFRNEYDIAFNPLGELFTYDADMEWDVGTPWYRPTRVNHVISGGEFGWRNGTGKWPAYYPDSFGAAVDIGPGSPTGICFGTGAKFPVKYQRALFVADWSYGNIFAVHLEEDGSTYGGTYETFATAAPLPVTDMVIHPEDGAMYFAIGGRRTQSGLYRMSYVGGESTEKAPIETSRGAAALRQLRHSLEVFHAEPADAIESAAAINAALPSLGHADAGVRFAARIALEHQPINLWQDKVLALENDRARIIGAVALARNGQPEDAPKVVASLASVDWGKLSGQGQLDLLRAYGLTFIRLAPPTDLQRAEVIAQLSPSFPSSDGRLNRELAGVMIYLKAPGVASQTVKLLNEAPSQEDQIQYAFVLRGLSEGWNDADRRAYFDWFNRAASARGGMSFGGFLDNIRKASAETLSDEERELYAELLKPTAPRDPMEDLAPREFVQKWTVAELESTLLDESHPFDFEQGKQMFAAAQCYKCHRMGVSGGILGPDLTGAGGRFSPKDLLTAIIEPNKEISDQYAATQFLTDSGRAITGRVINMNGNNLQVLTNLLDPSSLTSINRDEIELMRPAPNSLMPAELIDTLNRAEIMDLLGYLRAGGNSDHPIYTPANN